MIVSFNELLEKENHQIDVSLNLADQEITDALIKRINDVIGSVNITKISKRVLLFTFDCKYNVDYLDARDLTPLNLDFTFNDEIMLTDNEEKALELDIDYINEDDIDLRVLVCELILVNIPYNYSQVEVKKDQHESQEEPGVYHPFKNLAKEE